MEPKNDGSEFTCDRCGGNCWDPEQPQELEIAAKKCTKCDGEGKLDWIEKAVGKKEDDLLERISHHSIDPLGDIGCH